MKKELFKHYCYNGKLLHEYEHNGVYVRNGYYKQYHLNGLLSFKTQFKNNEQYGMCKSFTISGEKRNETLYIK